MPCTYVGIDEAGYGPDLGPLVMTAVAATGDAEFPPHLWRDLRRRVSRAGGRDQCVWVDDSKRILASPAGRDRLETAVLLLLAHLDPERWWPDDVAGLLRELLFEENCDHELDRWSNGNAHALPRRVDHEVLRAWLDKEPYGCRTWRITSIRTVVIGPARFNQLLDRHENKARVHFTAFAPLLDLFWRDAAHQQIHVVGDKHGGRHYYYELLAQTWPDVWIERGDEGAALSRYVFHGAERRLELRLRPRGDQADGLVALASMVSKYVRECWMEVFNDYWRAHLPHVRPTAGYPGDSARFRREVEAHAAALGHFPSEWWRQRGRLEKVESRIEA